MLTEKQAIKNITRFAKRSKVKHWAIGKVWYKEAHNYCQDISDDTGIPLHSVVGALAAMSPQCPWNENLEGTASMAYSKTVPPNLSIYPVNIDKAKRIIEGQNPNYVLGGLKVHAFYKNILRPTKYRCVTVDTHAARAAFGKYKLEPKELNFAFRPKGNKIIQQAYKQVAKKYHVLPLKLQATVWLRIKDDLKTLKLTKRG